MPQLKLNAESRLARQIFEAYLDSNDQIAAHRELDAVNDQIADVARALARLSHREREATLEPFALYINLMMEKIPPEVRLVVLNTALRFVFRIGWVGHAAALNRLM